MDLQGAPSEEVEVLGTEELPPRKPRRESPNLRLFEPAPAPPKPPAPIEKPPAEKSPGVDTAVDVFRTLGYVLSARALVLVFGLCGFAIAFVGALRESREVLFVFIAWNLLSVIPAIILEIVGRRRE